MHQDDRSQSRTAGQICFFVPSYLFQGIADSDRSNEQIKAEAATMLARMDDLSSGYKVNPFSLSLDAFAGFLMPILILL